MNDKFNFEKANDDNNGYCSHDIPCRYNYNRNMVNNENNNSMSNINNISGIVPIGTDMGASGDENTLGVFNFGIGFEINKNPNLSNVNKDKNQKSDINNIKEQNDQNNSTTQHIDNYNQDEKNHTNASNNKNKLNDSTTQYIDNYDQDQDYINTLNNDYQDNSNDSKCICICEDKHNTCSQSLFNINLIFCSIIVMMILILIILLIIQINK